MTERRTNVGDRRRHGVSRAPAIVLAGGMALAVGLVLLGARLAAVPAPPPDLSRPGTPIEPRQVNLILHDYAFNPTPLYLVPGETVQLSVVNGGLVEHELVLGDAAVQQAWARAHARATPPAAFATAPPVSVPTELAGLRLLLGSGASASVLYQVPRNRELQLYCHLPGHVEQGMVGEIALEDH